MIPGIEGPKTSNLPLGTCNRTNHPIKIFKHYYVRISTTTKQLKKNGIFKIGLFNRLS